MIGNFKVIDGHVHTFQSREIGKKIQKSFNNIYNIRFKNPGFGTVEEVKNNMNEIGLDYTVMVNFSSAKYVHDNNLWTLGVAAENKNLIPLVSFHPDMKGNKCELLDSYIKSGAKGIKLHPMAQNFNPNHKKMQDLYKLCNELELPIVFHCGRVSNAKINEFSDIEEIMPVIDRYPKIKFIITHMADGNFDDVLMLGKTYGNVYFDTSIVITGYPELMKVNEPSWLDDRIVIEVIDQVGAERIIFGSDYPWGSVKHDIHRFMNLELDDERKKLILGENAIRLFKIE